MTVVWFDFETRSPVNLKKRRVHNYARHPETEVLVLAWSYGADEHVHVWSPKWCSPNPPAETISELEELFHHVTEGAVCVAHNAIFDFCIWNEVLVKKYGAPPLPRTRLLDNMAQVEASNCPGGLDGSAKALRVPFQKNKEGHSLIRALCIGTKAEWVNDAATREKMRRFRLYAQDDIRAMRATFHASRKLTLPEWGVYHASEKINHRGVLVDVEFAKAATAFAAQENAEVNAELQDLTGDSKMSVAAHTRKAKWAFDTLEAWPDLQSFIARPPKDGKARYGLDQETRDALSLALENKLYTDNFSETLQKVSDFIDKIDAANSSAVKKFQAIVDCVNDDDRVRGMYAFNGGGQTGRWSSRGVQTHNMVNKPLEEDCPNTCVEFKDAIVNGDMAVVDEILERVGLSLTRALGRASRSTFIARPGYVLVWGDWRSVEWVTLPWLSDSDGGRKRLEAFEAGLDPYILAASKIHRVPYKMIQKKDPRRQEGKIAELALGFLGGVGALTKMAKKFGTTLTRDRAKMIVDAWREAEHWCVVFGNKCMGTVERAMQVPNKWFKVGRIAYRFVPGLMNGSIVCRLPSGRLIHYPDVKVERVLNEEWGKVVTQITYRKSKGKNFLRSSLWRGDLLNNATQGTANDLLRRVIVTLQDDIVLHTHDEIVIEVREDLLDAKSAELKMTLEDVPDWAEGLPLKAELEHGPYYYK